jgi:hypothetical protein
MEDGWRMDGGYLDGGWIGRDDVCGSGVSNSEYTMIYDLTT